MYKKKAPLCLSWKRRISFACIMFLEALSRFWLLVCVWHVEKYCSFSSCFHNLLIHFSYYVNPDVGVFRRLTRKWREIERDGERGFPFPYLLASPTAPMSPFPKIFINMMSPFALFPSSSHLNSLLSASCFPSCLFRLFLLLI